MVQLSHSRTEEPVVDTCTRTGIYILKELEPDSSRCRIHLFNDEYKFKMIVFKITRIFTNVGLLLHLKEIKHFFNHIKFF